MKTIFAAALTALAFAGCNAPSGGGSSGAPASPDQPAPNQSQVRRVELPRASLIPGRENRMEYGGSELKEEIVLSADFVFVASTDGSLRIDAEFLQFRSFCSAKSESTFELFRNEAKVGDLKTSSGRLGQGKNELPLVSGGSYALRVSARVKAECADKPLAFVQHFTPRVFSLAPVRDRTPLDYSLPDGSLEDVVIRSQMEMRGSNGTASAYCEVALTDTPSGNNPYKLMTKLWYIDSRLGGNWLSSGTASYPTDLGLRKLIDEVAAVSTEVRDSTGAVSIAVTLVDRSTTPNREIYIYATGRKSVSDTSAKARELYDFVENKLCQPL